jgi:hypothetical protein
MDTASMVVPDSLGETLDGICAADFAGLTLAPDVRRKTANWIAARCGTERSYAGMPAPTPGDFRHGIQVFTGERIESGAGVAHILGEEACRAVRRLDVKGTTVTRSLRAARESISRRVLAPSVKPPGFFCCGICTVALWRNLTAGDFPEGDRLAATGLAALKAHRDGKGRWRRFPYHYTLLALLELFAYEPAAVKAELMYTRSSCERSMKATRGEDVYALRRREVMERVLALES